MIDLGQALRDFAGLFDRLDIPYVVMGGLAVRLYGIPRPTHDIDFTIALDRSRLPELFAAAEEFGYTASDDFLSGWVDQIAGMPLVKLQIWLDDRGIDIDIFLAESPYQTELLARRQSHRIGDQMVWFVSPEDLILLKLVASRPRDIADIGDVLFTQGTLDESYMRRWARTLNVEPALERALEHFHNM